MLIRENTHLSSWELYQSICHSFLFQEPVIQYIMTWAWTLSLENINSLNGPFKVRI